MLSNHSFHQVEWEAESPGIEHAGEFRNRTCEVSLAPLLCLVEVPEPVTEGGGNMRLSGVAEGGENTHLGAALKGRHTSRNVPDV
jgi:hypothetical protein